MMTVLLVLGVIALLGVGLIVLVAVAVSVSTGMVRVRDLRHLPAYVWYRVRGGSTR